MPDQQRSGSLKDDLGDVVGVSILVITLVNLGLSAALSWVVENQGFRAGHEEWAQFVIVYLSTIALSVTLTVAIAVYAIPRMYGYDMLWLVPLLVIILGAVFASSLAGNEQWNPFENWPSGGWWGALAAFTLKALQIFATLYGHEFISGTITGLGGGVMLIVIAHKRRQNQLGDGSSVDAPDRPPLPWVGGLVLVIGLVALGSWFVDVVVPEIIKANTINW